MNEPINKSEVARLRQQYEDEYRAAQWGLTGLASGTARHRFITRRMENMGRCHTQLANLLGERTATHIVSETVKDL